MLRQLPVQNMVDTFQNMTDKLLSETFPIKKITISPDDRPWFNENLRKLKRLRQREYSKHGRSEKYLKIMSSFTEKSKAEILKYMNKIKSEVTEGKRGSTYPAIKRMGVGPAEPTQAGFQLPAHAELNLSSAQSAEIIAEHFSKISQEYSPLNVSKLPPNVQLFLQKNYQILAP